MSSYLDSSKPTPMIPDFFISTSIQVCLGGRKIAAREKKDNKVCQTHQRFRDAGYPGPRARHDRLENSTSDETKAACWA
ncbi:hypothetical protein E4U14_005736 [Claviceps sp. LM454 group G7]|nr:hypothetical protein E4U14_005736 [Claviceps sp. LM454 group G7]